MPPSEHVLIDELSYRGARVIASSNGSGGGWWLVVRGDVPTKGLAKILHHQIDMLEEIEAESRAALLSTIRDFAINAAKPTPPAGGA